MLAFRDDGNQIRFYDVFIDDFQADPSPVSPGFIIHG